jgi:hypothetical protein
LAAFEAFDESTPHPEQSGPATKPGAFGNPTGHFLSVKDGGIVNLGRLVVRGQCLSRGFPENPTQTLSRIVHLLIDCLGCL